MDTHHLATHLRNTRRPSNLGDLLDRAISYGKSKGTEVLDDLQQSGGEALEEKVAEATGSEAIGKAARAAADAAVDEAQGQTPEYNMTAISQLPLLKFDPNYLTRKYATLSPAVLQMLANRRSTDSTSTGSSQESLVLDNQPFDAGPAKVPEVPKTKSASSGSKTGWIIGGSILGVVLIGGGVFLATRKK